MEELSIQNDIVKRKLREAIQELNARGMQKAAAWALEQVIGMAEDETRDQSYPVRDVYEGLNGKDVDVLLLARSLVQSGEYQRCNHILQTHEARPSSHHKSSAKQASHISLYLRSYARYMAGEKLREQVGAEAAAGSAVAKEGLNPDGTPANPNAKPAPKDLGPAPTTETERRHTSKNRNLQSLHVDLARLYWEGHLSGDGFLLYMFAVVTRDLYRQEGRSAFSVLATMKQQQLGGTAGSEDGEVSARQLFLESLHAFPWNWSCWLELAELCVAEKQALPSWPDILHCQSRAPHNANSEVGEGLESAALMYGSFLAHVYLEKHCGELAMQVIRTAVEPVVPHSLILLSQVGLAQYTLRLYDAAEATFEAAREQDPYRLAHMDTYSNILYVKEKRAELSRLAHAVVEVDKFCPESCCVVGNYYSLKGRHESAVTYFQRAIKLNNNYLSAWTLMGHEYMELRNTAAAVQCYRNAVGISEVDYRAWYGLGQTYEMLHLYQYAHYYYRKAAYLRPADARMWGAVGNCLLKLGLREQAIVGFERAVRCGDQEGVATRDLARLCREEGQSARAAEFYQQFLQISRFFEGEGESDVEAAGADGGARAASTRGQTAPNSLGALLGSPGGVGGAEGGAVGATKLGGAVDAEQAEAVLFLARYHAAQGDGKLAEALCARLQSFNGPEGEEARVLLRSLQAARQPQLSAHLGTARRGEGVHGSGDRDISGHTPGSRSASKTSRRQSGFHVFGSGGSHHGTPMATRGRGGLASTPIGGGAAGEEEDMITPSQSLEMDYNDMSL